MLLLLDFAFVAQQRGDVERYWTLAGASQAQSQRTGIMLAGSVEDFIDLALSIENLIDPNRVFLESSPPPPPGEDEEEMATVGRIRTKEYLESFVNPPEFLEAQRKKLEEQRARKRRVPERPERDLLLFLVHYAPLDRWQQDVLEVVREESYYFLPQRQTKIINVFPYKLLEVTH